MSIKTHSPWLFCPKPKPNATTRLIGLPYAGGTATAFMSWFKAMPQHVELTMVQYPGRGSRYNEPLLTELEDMVAGVVSALSPLNDKPMIIFGHSMGARIAYEVALTLSAEHNNSPQALIVSGSRAPHQHADPNTPYAKRTAARGGVPIYELDRGAFIEELRFLQGTPEAVLENDELLDLVIPSLRADFQLARDYEQKRPYQPVSCPLVSFCGDQDSTVTPKAVAGWSELTTAGAQHYQFSGEHFFIHDQQEAVLRILNKEIERICASWHYRVV